MDEDPDLQWLLDAGLSHRSVDGIVSRMQQGSWSGGPYGFANEMITRLSAHLGDMAVPLSLHYVDIDLFPRTEPNIMDEAAQRVAQRLLTQST